MGAWTEDEIQRIAGAQELEIAARRSNGALRKPVPVWVVRVGDDLYVRSAYGPGSSWYRAATASREGHVAAGGVERDVAFEDADRDLIERVDAAYGDKYSQYASIVDSLKAPEIRATTIRLVPH
jgi:hypothetical protein